MSLMDSLVILDPYAFETWIAYRTSGAGSGTASDPYDGSTAARFDQIMRSLPSNVPVTVHLGPSPLDSQQKPMPFQTLGYYDGAAATYGWRARPNLRIIGAGVNTTFLQLVVNSKSSPWGHVSTYDSADKPPIFEKHRWPRETHAKNFFLKCLIRDLY